MEKNFITTTANINVPIFLETIKELQNIYEGQFIIVKQKIHKKHSKNRMP
jgi:hypothetical protein